MAAQGAAVEAEARAVELAEAALVAPAAELEAAREEAPGAALGVAPGAALAEEAQAQAQAVADRAEGSITPPKTSPGRRSRRT